MCGETSCNNATIMTIKGDHLPNGNPSYDWDLLPYTHCEDSPIVSFSIADPS